MKKPNSCRTRVKSCSGYEASKSKYHLLFQESVKLFDWYEKPEFLQDFCEVWSGYKAVTEVVMVVKLRLHGVVRFFKLVAKESENEK